MRVAFYAPMKPPTHPVPSGDRLMARQLTVALAAARLPTYLPSELRLYDGKGDAERQAKLIAEADTEVERILTEEKPDLWFTYHCYYKAPDLIGPRIAKAFDIPYAIAEASRAKKRLSGPWSTFAAHAEAAMDAADVIFAMTEQDRVALDRDKPEAQRIVDLPPFVLPGSSETRPKTSATAAGDSFNLLTVAMMRGGAKLESYCRLAAAVGVLSGDWHLTIIGDGAMRAEVEVLFAPFAAQVSFMGEVSDQRQIRDAYESADVFLWPGVNEAYGMVYLEAQAAGLPVVAEDHPGPRSVVADPQMLAPADDPSAFASAIRRVAADRSLRSEARQHVIDNHSDSSAAKILSAALGPLL